MSSRQTNHPLRTDAWLIQELDSIWRGHFGDVRREPVHIQFGRRCRARLGSIRLQRGRTSIRVNGLFRLPSVPAFVVRATIAHELAHYAHGFGSPRPRLHRYPHRGRVIDRELADRGLGETAREAKEWLDQNWELVVRSSLGSGRRSAGSAWTTSACRRAGLP